MIREDGTPGTSELESITIADAPPSTGRQEQPSYPEHDAPEEAVRSAGNKPVPVTAATRLSILLHAIGAVLVLPFSPLPPAPRGRWNRIAIGFVTLMAIAFVVFFTLFTSAKFDAYLTNAEDMGIMDQALWNTVHGALLHQTICNPISDSNCLGNVTRFAIHFEPLMLPLSLVYLIAPSPKTLLFIQMLVVATGAYPAYWIASRRLRSPLAGICIAGMYLTFPALQSAVLFDFHAVTLSSAFLLFALYFMLTRNNVGLFIAAILSMATKEEVPLDVVMIGLAIVCFQRRWRVGAALIALACVWLGAAELIMHVASPVGHSPTAGRYAYLGAGPVQAGLYILTHLPQLVRHQILGNGGAFYLQTLLTPDAYLAILAPMVWILAAPPLLINLLSSDPHMHAGIHQYSAEIVPFFVFSAIAAMALVVAAAEGIERSRTVAYVKQRLAGPLTTIPRSLSNLPYGIYARLRAASRHLHLARVALIGMVVLIAFFSLRQQHRLAYLPVTHAFHWPVVTAHAQLADALNERIPATASVSAQDTLVPHLSERHFIYQYPYGAYEADYVFLDTQSGIYPFTDQGNYEASIQALFASGQFTVLVQEDGYILLKRNHLASSGEGG